MLYDVASLMLVHPSSYHRARSLPEALERLAALRRTDGDVRLLLSGVAPKPWRVTSSIEEDVASGGLDERDVATLADRALYDARPLARDGYRVDLAAALLRRATTAMVSA